MSSEGCLVESEAPPAEGEYLELTLDLPDREPPIMIESAAVRWVKNRMFGLQFLYMSLGDHDRLDHFITEFQAQTEIAQETDGPSHTEQ